MQLLQLDAVSATIYDCIMQFQCINTCESWPLLPSKQQIFNFEFRCSSWGFEILVVSSEKYMQISCACIVGLIWVKYFQVDWKTWLETLITCFHWSVLRTPGGLARSKETNAFNIRNFGQGIGGPRNDTILVGLLFQDGKKLKIYEEFLLIPDCSVGFLSPFKMFHSDSRTEFAKDNS